MAEPCPAEFVEFAGRLADAAGQAIRGYFRTGLGIETKADLSPVTAADRAAEKAMRLLIEARYPAHGIQGEELGTAREDAPLRWILDPIDGTKSFVAGLPLFGTLIALTENGRPLLGVIDQPILKERWAAAEGRGATFNGQPARTRRCPKLAEAVLFTTSIDQFDAAEAAAFRRVAGAVGVRRYAGDCYAYALVASGFADLVVESRVQPWDFAALVPLLQQAGGAIADWEGRPLDCTQPARLVAAGDPALLPQAVALLKA